jgi:hypothetical protein
MTVTVEQARIGMDWLVREWGELEHVPWNSDPDREARFSARFAAWIAWDLRLFVTSAYTDCVMGDGCPDGAPLCCGGCARKRAAKT